MLSLKLVMSGLIVMLVGVGGTAYAAPTPSTTNIRLATWNIWGYRTRDVALELRELFRQTDVIGLQEVWDEHVTHIKSELLCRGCGYEATPSSGDGSGGRADKVMIMWKQSKFRKVSSGMEKVFEPRGQTIPAKFITWVRLQDVATGRQFYVLNTHLVPGADHNARPKSDSAGQVEAYRDHMDKLAGLIRKLKQRGEPVFVTGDFNCDYRYDSQVRNAIFPYARLGQVGARSSYQGLHLAGIGNQGTYGDGNRLIDYVFYTPANHTRAVSESISQSKHGSDHHALFATFGISDAAQVSAAAIHATPRPQVLGNATNIQMAAAKPEPAPELPHTGVEAVAGGAGGLSVAGYAYYIYRSRRRALAQALRRRH